MLTLQYRRGPVSMKAVWFANQPRLTSACGAALYFHCVDHGEVLGFVRRPIATKVVDLYQDEAALLANCKSEVPRKWRRASRDGVSFRVVDDFAEFLPFYNAFAEEKGLAPLVPTRVADYAASCLIFQAVADGQPIVMNAFLVDREGGRAYMMHSASHFRRLEQSDARNFVGRANLFLHLESMKYMKSQGFGVYDFGGYAVDTTDPILLGINRFKDEFGGTLIREATYVSWPLFAAYAVAGKRLG